MSASDCWLVVALLVGVFFTGRAFGFAQGLRAREERTERQRGIEAKALLDFTHTAWRKQ